jgi:signal transduction histidine kinase
MITQAQTQTSDLSALDEVVRSFPIIIDNLRSSYVELESRAARVDDELSLTNKKLAEKVQELDGLKRNLEEVFESLPCGVVVRDADANIVELNSKAQSILGMSLETLAACGTHSALQGAAADGQAHEISQPGSDRLVLANKYSPVRRSDGQLQGSVEIIEDQTERVLMLERLHTTDKMAALGTMASGIAHEIRNPLNAINGFARLMMKRPGQDEKTARWCKLIFEAGSEANTIIESMLSFGSPQRLQLQTIDPDELIEGAIRLALPTDYDSSRVQITSDIQVPPFAADRIKLRQAIRNLVANAVHAQLGASQVRVHLTLTHDEQQLSVCVSDAGPGVSPEISQQIFDPFFTNHPDGTGLGLALVSTIVHLHGGSVSISPDPSPFGGAEFFIRIPFKPASSPLEIPHPSLEG